jgi:hypothetical protein
VPVCCEKNDWVLASLLGDTNEICFDFDLDAPKISEFDSINDVRGVSDILLCEMSSNFNLESDEFSIVYN